MIESIIRTFLADALPHRQLYNTAPLSLSLSHTHMHLRFCTVRKAILLESFFLSNLYPIC